MNLQSLDIGEPVENLIGAVVVLAVRDATEGDAGALEWLQVCAPDIAQHLMGGQFDGKRGRRTDRKVSRLVESIHPVDPRHHPNVRTGIAHVGGGLAGHFQDRQAEKVDRGIAA